ncbi:MAG: hypothetical protein IJY96_08590 [Oscillospiraceae bacterium]|nr:hypothetical protein [Oscillospiraceae bacterium]
MPILEGFGISPDEPILGTIAYVLGYFAPSIIGGILLLIWHSINRANKTQEPLTSTPQMPPLDSLPINQKLSDKEVEQSVSHLHKTRRSWGIRAAIIVLVVAIMLSIGANVHQFQQIQSLTEIKNSQDTEISKLERQLEDAQDSIATWIDKYEYAMVYKNYMDQHIVFLPNDASYIYHKFDCWVIEGKSCFIYNEELAQSYGYKACSLCH